MALPRHGAYSKNLPIEPWYSRLERFRLVLHCGFTGPGEVLVAVSSISQMITLLVPTMNRSDFLIRLLCYYRDLEFQGCIYVGDSSQEFHATRTKRAINAFDRQLHIVYCKYPDRNNAECIRDLLALVSTPYAVLLADDDFLVPDSMEQCVMFLESHPEYSAAHGVAVLFHLESSGAHGPLKWVDR